MFAADGRPSVEAVERLLTAQPGRKALEARVSHSRGFSEGWLELLASGLTFDLTGLDPAAAAPLPEARYFFGLPQLESRFTLEAIALGPAPHIAGGRAMIPVVRTLTALAVDLALSLGAAAVCWTPAQSWMDPNYFARIIQAWLGGGAFPALGLTAIERTPDGGVQSQGLAFFIGQELRVDARSGEAAADTVKLALRMIDHLVRDGAINGRRQLVGSGGETLMAEPSKDGRLVRLWRER